ncbi:MAG: potassium-transporting ATPase subunit KdpC [Hyphomicrobiaceae bacterium]
MLRHLRPAVVMTVCFTLLLGIVYPLALTGLAQLGRPAGSDGSLIVREGVVVGSSLIGQAFTTDRYFHGRPSAAGASGYDAAASSGSNLGPLSAKLIERVKADADRLRGEGMASLPGDAVTASASGLDPHISPDFAALQVNRVAMARQVPTERVAAIVNQSIEDRFLGLIGEPRVNVLKLNMALDVQLKPGG